MKDIGTFSSMELQDYAALARICSNRTVDTSLIEMIMVTINVERRDSYFRRT